MIFNSPPITIYYLPFTNYHVVMSQQRLQKILAAAGISSRRKCEELILEGVVRVNGRVVDSLPAFADPQVDVITVNGRKLRSEQKVYFLLNKPKGIICTTSDPHGRKTAIDLVPCRQRLLCAGRLDTETSGLIILTNDSEMLNRLTHPRYELRKTYTISLKGQMAEGVVEKIKKGFWLSAGGREKAAVKILKAGSSELIFEATVCQSLNRDISSILARMGLTIKSLRRTKIGRIDAKGVGIGSFRPLTDDEIAYLKKTTGGW